MRPLAIIPVMIVPVILYNIMAFSGTAYSGVDAMRARLDTDFLSVPMASGVTWSITPGHALLAMSLLMFFFEVIRATRTGRVEVMNHAISLVLFVLCLMQFLLMPAFATSVFGLISAMALLDVLAGMSIGIASARRDFAVDAKAAG